ncbi:hypothetical protein [Streptomyces panaciradicis]|uniref:hypothetical protein n=1 Tax=Streptomyces panaciradicis TaxID=1470261 RepID=UPI00201D00CA|nr:hypothetical protein [Streptomyces panaciradicis]MCL6668419.1 hypothetical protein [Streptomyces panaciradicis]
MPARCGTAVARSALAGWNNGSVDVAAELHALIGSLSREEGVFGGVVDQAGGSVAEAVHQVVTKAEDVWKDYAVEGAVGPDTPAEVEDALSQIDGERAVELLAYLATDDLVFPGTRRRDRAHAHRAAERVVRLLGQQSVWYTNINDLSPRARAWDRVTRHTFDGVVAGTGGSYTVVLLQVGED